MKSTNNFVEYLLLLAHLILLIRLALGKAILLIDHIPNGRSIIIGEGLDIIIEIKILSLIIFFILDMPNPVDILASSSLFFPNIHTPTLFFLNFICTNPIHWNIFLIATTDCTTLGTANTVANV